MSPKQGLVILLTSNKIFNPVRRRSVVVCKYGLFPVQKLVSRCKQSLKGDTVSKSLGLDSHAMDQDVKQWSTPCCLVVFYGDLSPAVQWCFPAVKEPGESAMRNETRKRESVRALTADTLAWTSSRLATATTLVVCRLSSGVQVSGCTEALSSHFFGDALQCLYLTYLGSTLVMFLMGWWTTLPGYEALTKVSMSILDGFIVQ